MRGTLISVAMLLACASSAAAAEQPICPDRPSKSTGPCTVPAGRMQVETGLVDWARSNSGSGNVELTSVGSSLIKYGLANRADVEIGITPLVLLDVDDGAAHVHRSSVGDTLIRMKYRLTQDSSPVQVAVDPFIKLPTANSRIGDGKVEGGVTVPVSAPVGRTGVTITIDPELDILADVDGAGRHLATLQVVNLAAPISSNLSVSAELWGSWNWDPAATVKQVSIDGSLAWLVSTSVQLDAGANLGLNRATPDVEIYAGISVRF